MNVENDRVAELAEYVVAQQQRFDEMTYQFYELKADVAQHDQDQLWNEIRNLLDCELTYRVEQIKQEFTKDLVRGIATEFLKDVQTLCSI